MKLMRLRVELVKRDMSQAALARAVGRSPSHICRIILGRIRARAKDRRRIAEALAVTEAALFPRRKWRRRQPGGTKTTKGTTDCPVPRSR